MGGHKQRVLLVEESGTVRNMKPEFTVLGSFMERQFNSIINSRAKGLITEFKIPEKAWNLMKFEIGFKGKQLSVAIDRSDNIICVIKKTTTIIEK